MSVVVLSAVVGCSEPSRLPTPVVPVVTPESGITPLPANDAATQAELEALLTQWSAMDMPADPPPSPPPENGVWTLSRGGRVLAEGPMREGMREGLWRRYDESGQRIEEGRYEGDLPVGRWHRWRSDGTAMNDVVYGDDACSAPPERIDQPIYCGTAILAGWVPPVDPAPLESFGIGETRRCVGRAEPWIVEGLSTPRRSPWRDLLSVAHSPELQQIVWAHVLADLSREDVGFHFFAAHLAAHGAPEERAWITELALSHPDALASPTYLAIVERARTAPGFAARWYLEARRRERLHGSHAMMGVLVRVIGAMAEADPNVALPLTADASALLSGANANFEGHFSVIRADRYLDLADPEHAGLEIQRALIAFRVGDHANPQAMVAELKSRRAAVM